MLAFAQKVIWVFRPYQHERKKNKARLQNYIFVSEIDQQVSKTILRKNSGYQTRFGYQNRRDEKLKKQIS